MKKGQSRTANGGPAALSKAPARYGVRWSAVGGCVWWHVTVLNALLGGGFGGNRRYPEKVLAGIRLQIRNIVSEIFLVII